MGEPQWYKDAVIYELHVRAFCDSDGDGMGDFRGLSRKLDYLRDLGVTAVWLLPFYPSPWFDDGYDISDYTAVHPAYGSIRDFRSFLRAAHKRDIRVITELVINHTSSRHPWFERARRAKPGSTYRDYYVWSDTPGRYRDARIIFQDFEVSNWTWDPVAGAYYWHRFYANQPDLNFDNPSVRRAVIKVLDFWLKLGVDGLRLDAVPYLFEREYTNCENLPETHQFLKELRAHVEEHYSDRMLLAEANQWPEDAVGYFGEGDECHMCFHFPLMPRLFMSAKMEDRFPIIDILEQTPPIPEPCQWGIFLRNHDELTLEMVTDEERDYMYQVYARNPRSRINLGIRRRLAPLLDNNRRMIELLNVLLFSLPGTPIIYYGDEIGMGDNVYLGDRDGVRTPMQWSPDRNAGFSQANPQKLYLPVIIDPEYHYEALNVETQQANPTSLLWWMKRLIATRKSFRAFSRGELRFVHSGNAHVLSFLRIYDNETVLVVVNFSRHVQAVDLELEEYAGASIREVFSRNEFPRIKEEPYVITIGGHDYYWFQIVSAEDHARRESGPEAPAVTFTFREWKEMPETAARRLVTGPLPDHLRHARWFRSKTRTIRKTSIIDTIAVREAMLLVLSLEYTQGEAERYVLPIAFAAGAAAARIAEEIPHAVVCPAVVDGEEGVVYDGLFNPSFREEVLLAMVRRKRLKKAGDLTGSAVRGTQVPEGDGPVSRVLSAEQTNSSILFRDRLFCKVYRKLEPMPSPDVELTRHLSRVRKFEHVPAYRGTITYRDSEGTNHALALLTDFVPNEGDAWSFAQAAVDRYFEHVLTDGPELPAGRQTAAAATAATAGGDSSPPKTPTALNVQQIDDGFSELADSFFLEMVKLLGRRTGEFHKALADPRGEADFQPEPFSVHYQRGVYQSTRSLLKRVFAQAKRAARQDEALAEKLEPIWPVEGALLKRLGRIRTHKLNARKIRVHGDYHLGQVLFTGRDFAIIDLEGEPARPVSERRLKYSPFRDVAGMLRSFHYAVFNGFMRAVELRESDRDRLLQWIEPWYQTVSGIFLNEYLETVSDTEFVPDDEADRQVLLDVFLAEKAIYEFGYELDNRPDWVQIPIAGILAVAGAAAE